MKQVDKFEVSIYFEMDENCFLLHSMTIYVNKISKGSIFLLLCKYFEQKEANI